MKNKLILMIMLIFITTNVSALDIFGVSIGTPEIGIACLIIVLYILIKQKK